MKLLQKVNFKVNITSDLSISVDEKHMGLITRELSNYNSKYIYRLELYNLTSLKKKDTITIYQTYDQSTSHLLKFIPSHDKIVLINKYQILFYSIQPLSLIHQFLHEQSTIYNLQVSSNGKITVVIANQVIVFNNSKMKRESSPTQIKNARYCSFSSDVQYLAITSSNTMYIYYIMEIGSEYRFYLLQSTIAPLENGSITSVEYNQYNSNELVVGFLDGGVEFYKVDQEIFFTKITDTQPHRRSNIKKARYMPDGNRIYTYDFMEGIGIWPGPEQKLIYLENYLLYGIQPMKDGTQLIGYIWQNIKIIQIELECENGVQAVNCQCQLNQWWNPSIYKCELLVCQENSSGKIINHQCQCNKGYNFQKNRGICTITCSSKELTLSIQTKQNYCFCKNSYNWNSLTLQCQFDCRTVPFAKDKLILDLQCQCIDGFIWNSINLECSCPSFMLNNGYSCVCYDQYVQINNRCILDCKKIPMSIGSTSQDQQCICFQGFYFYENNQHIVSCRRNCTNISNSIHDNNINCLCQENTQWNSTREQCSLNCQQIAYTNKQQYSNDSCGCAVNYVWMKNIYQCGKNCTGILNVNTSQSATLRLCPCYTNFTWNNIQNRCEVNCQILLHTYHYKLSNYNECQCQTGYYWNNSHYECHINCTSIYDAHQSLSYYQCSCKHGKTFSSQNLTCHEINSSPVFSNPAIIAGFVLFIIAVLIILGLLIRFCWQFRKNKKQHKKMKKYKPKLTKTNLINQNQQLQITQNDRKINKQQKQEQRQQKQQNLQSDDRLNRQIKVF